MPGTIPNPAQSGIPDLEQATRQPRLAWPTLGLFALSCLLWGSGTVLGVQGVLAPGWAIAINVLASYWFFTVLHDAAHRAVCERPWVNDWLGRVSLMPIIPFPIFRAFRFIHMQHHRFANEPPDRDPDAYTGGGPRWLLPLRWATVDLKYYAFYLQHLGQRPVSERVETGVAALLNLSVIGLALGMGWGMEMLLCWLIPGRIALALLAFAFDYLPHHPRLSTQRENPWRATNNRQGLEWLLTPLLLWQNYHLVHHLYPRAPFYRYGRIWKAGEAVFMANNPLLVDLMGREVRRPALAASVPHRPGG